jgi:hypothetical protein
VTSWIGRRERRLSPWLLADEAARDGRWVAAALEGRRM